MAFSTRFEIAKVSFTSSTSATTSLALSKITSISRCFAIGLKRFKINSNKELISIVSMFKSGAVLSSFTRDNKSLIILFSLSISSAISTINSLYNSTGTSSCAIKESANTFMEVIGVFNSWETLDTNSCLESSKTFIFFNSSLKASMICSVSK